MEHIKGVITAATRAARWAWRRTIRSEAGEGVISAAIAVLIMAFLGVGMWFGFRATLGNTQKKVDNQVTQIGTDNGSGPGPSGSGAGVGGTGTGVGGTGAGVNGTGTGGTSSAAPAGG
jgi:hypothetical protein